MSGDRLTTTAELHDAVTAYLRDRGNLTLADMRGIVEEIAHDHPYVSRRLIVIAISHVLLENTDSDEAVRSLYQLEGITDDTVPAQLLDALLSLVETLNVEDLSAVVNQIVRTHPGISHPEAAARVLHHILERLSKEYATKVRRAMYLMTVAIRELPEDVVDHQREGWDAPANAFLETVRLLDDNLTEVSLVLDEVHERFREL